MEYPKPLVKIVGEVVQMVSDAILTDIQAAQLAVKVASMLATDPGADISGITSDIQSINYVYDTHDNIAKYIKEKQQEPGENGIGGKYDLMPMIALFMPFPEALGSTNGYFQKADLNIGIFYYSEQQWSTKEHYDNNFEPVLLPIYHNFIKMLKECAYFDVQDERKIIHTKIELPYGTNDDGKGNKNIFGELLDAIKISNISLTILDY